MNVSLYHIDTDPNETKDVASTNPETVQILWYELMAYQKTGIPPASSDPSCTSDPTHPNVTGVGPIWQPWCN